MRRRRKIVIWFSSFIIVFVLMLSLILPFFNRKTGFDYIQDFLNGGKDKNLVPLGDWWDNDWDYYKTLELVNPHASYPVKLIVDKNDAGSGNVSCGGHCQDDFDDIRFVYNNATELPYWRGHYESGVQAEFYINTTASNYSKFEMFYGNAGASTTSNGANVFISFDDEDWNTDWTNNYLSQSGDQAYSGVYSGLHDGDNHTSAYDWFDIEDIDNSGEWTFDFSFYTLTAYTDYMILTDTDGLHDANKHSVMISPDGSDIRYRDDPSWIVFLSGMSSGCWYDFSFRNINFDSDTFDIYVNGSQVKVGAGFRNPQTQSQTWQIGSSSTSTWHRFYVDAVRLSPWVDKFPIWLGFSSEHSQAPSNNNPVIGVIVPVDGDGGVVPGSQFSFAVSDVDDDNQDMNITCSSNSSGSWVLFSRNESVNNGTYYYANSNFSEYGKKYWWRINLSDGNGGWDNETYSFTTEIIASIGTSITCGHNGTNDYGHDPDSSTYTHDVISHQYPYWAEQYLSNVYSVESNLADVYTNTTPDWDKYNYGWGAGNMPIDYMNDTLDGAYTAFNSNREGWRIPSDPGDIKVIVVEGGHHDISQQNDDADKIYTDIFNLYNYTHSYGIRMVLLTMTPDYRTAWHDTMNTTNEQRRNFAGSHNDVWLADIFLSNLTSWNGGGISWSPNGDMYSDASNYVHPNGNGYNQMGRIVASAVDKAISNVSNNAPSLSGESPTDTASDQSTSPTCSVTVSDSDSDMLYARFFENTTGDWVLQYVYDNVSSGSNPGFIYTNASESGTNYYWRVNVTDRNGGYIQATYHFTTRDRQWQNIQTTINGSYSNTTLFRDIQITINGSYTNITSFRNIDITINGSYSNTSVFSWQTVNNTINGSYVNTTIYQNIDITINGSYVNTTIYQDIQIGINGSYSNTTIFRTIDNTINGSYSNVTEDIWQDIQIAINGSYSNTTTFQDIQTSINGSYTNTTVFRDIDTTVNGSYSNTTLFQDIDITINGSYTNTTILTWQVIDNTINGSYSNTTIFKTIDSTINGSYTNTSIKLWQNIQTTINGSYSNDTITWQNIQTTINGSYSNTSATTMNITNIYPSNGSNIQMLQPTIYFTINHPNGSLMNYTIHIGTDPNNLTTILTNDTNVGNGTYYYSNFYIATNYYTVYYWDIILESGSASINPVYHFKSIRSGGSGSGRSSNNIAIGLAGGLFSIVFIIVYLKRRRNNYDI